MSNYVSYHCLACALLVVACGGDNKGLTGLTSLADPTFAGNSNDDDDDDDNDDSEDEGSASMVTSSTSATDTPTSTTSGVETSASTTTAVDPTTSTTADPSTTTSDDTTGVMTTMTTTTTTTTRGDETTSETSGDPPPDQDAQPKGGLFEDCAERNNCDPSTAGCISLLDDNMTHIDGYCTDYCVSVADCGTPLDVPATLACIDNTGPMNLCALLCEQTADCPIGMECQYYISAALYACF